MKNTTFPIVLMALGSLFLLHSLDLVPSMRWLWIVGLLAAGVMVLIADGITKSSIVVGPLLILAGVLQFFSMHSGLAYNIIIPLMMIALGGLLLVARSDAIPEQPKNQQAVDAAPDAGPHEPS